MACVVGLGVWLDVSLSGFAGCPLNGGISGICIATCFLVICSGAGGAEACVLVGMGVGEGRRFCWEAFDSLGDSPSRRNPMS